MAAPLAMVGRPKRRRYYHVKAPKPGCLCSRCARLVQHAEDLRGVIAIYEARLAVFRRELAEVTT